MVIYLKKQAAQAMFNAAFMEIQNCLQQLPEVEALELAINIAQAITAVAAGADISEAQADF